MTLLAQAQSHIAMFQSHLIMELTYVMVFTTYEQGTAAQVLQWYRMRWQIGLVFKRLKSLLRLGHRSSSQRERQSKHDSHAILRGDYLTVRGPAARPSAP